LRRGEDARTLGCLDAARDERRVGVGIGLSALTGSLASIAFRFRGPVGMALGEVLVGEMGTVVLETLAVDEG
jgi:hypothetical protein